MKYLFSLFLITPILMSCTVVEEQYYAPGYVVPPPRVEVVPEYPRHYHGHAAYRPAPAGQVYHGHTNVAPGAVVVNPRAPQPTVRVQPNVHGHSSAPVVVTRPQQPQAQVRVQNNVHGHVEVQKNVHGHKGSNVARLPEAVPEVEIQQNTHGHN